MQSAQSRDFFYQRWFRDCQALVIIEEPNRDAVPEPHVKTVGQPFPAIT
jgi:hypothetical protein